jgi:alpha-glucosidase
MNPKIIFMKNSLWIALFLLGFSKNYAADKIFRVQSPDHSIEVVVHTGDKIYYQVSVKGTPVTAENFLSMTLGDGQVLGRNSSLKKTNTHSVNQDIQPGYGMAAVYKDYYNELELVYSNHFSIFFRVYNDGVAYRFVTGFPGRIKVKEEEVNYAFNENAKASMLKVAGFMGSYEEHYVDDHISFLDSGKIAALPLLVESNGYHLGITESDLLDYPGTYLTYGGKNELNGTMPKFVISDTLSGYERIPDARADYVAATSGSRSFPWRLMIIAQQDKDLLYNNLVWLLASENKIGDASWVKPGKVAWDWWCALNLTGVDFKTGINTNTYKYFIDFAAENNLEYIVIDEGWSDDYDLLKVKDGTINPNPGGKLDLPFLFDYAKKKNIGIILWCVWHTLDRQMNEALDQFQKWGVKGIKVDFMDRDDQAVINFYERTAREAAKRKLIVDFHGASKPAGLERTYPNVLNREAVQGLEYDKFSKSCTPDHAAHIPFIRMLAGAMDYTPGGLTNVNQNDFRVVNDRPMTQGTRCQQLAMFTMFYAPLEMLTDAPTAYQKEPVILNYLASMPTTWDETIPLQGKVGDYAIIARRKGEDWFVAGITDWTERTVSVKFDFLKDQKYNAEIFTDGVNASRIGNDYIHTNKQIGKGESLDFAMAKGGGFAIRLTPVK